MDGLIGILIFIWIMSRIFGGAKKTAKNAPKRQQGAVRPAPVPVKSEPEPVKVEPLTYAEGESVYGGYDEKEERETPNYMSGSVLDETDYAVSDLAEGESRECSHGSRGGSMDITEHTGMGEEFVHAEQQVKTTVTTTVATKVKTRVKASRGESAETDSASASGAMPAMSASQMRQAIVMAEILKRPAERFRRWPSR